MTKLQTCCQSPAGRILGSLQSPIFLKVGWAPRCRGCRSSWWTGRRAGTGPPTPRHAARSTSEPRMSPQVSGHSFRIRNRIRRDLRWFWSAGFGYGSRRAKSGRNFIFWSGGCSLLILRAKSFSCSLDVHFHYSCNFWSSKVQNHGSGSGSASASGSALT